MSISATRQGNWTITIECPRCAADDVEVCYLDGPSKYIAPDSCYCGTYNDATEAQAIAIARDEFENYDPSERELEQMSGLERGELADQQRQIQEWRRR